MNREKAIRAAFYSALNGHLSVTIDGVPTNIPLYDSKMESNEDIYAIFSNQISIYDGNLTNYQWRSTIEIDIYHAQQNSATNDVVDDIGEVIESIVTATPKPTGVGIPQQSGWQMYNVQLKSVSNLRLKLYQSEAGIIVNKNMQFSLIIIKQ